jgi:hypothetical protein
MSFQRMDADTAETVAGVVLLLRRAAELVWVAADVEGAGSPRQVLGLGIDLAADEARNLTAPARIIGMRPQGEAEIAIEQGETRYEGVTWTKRSQIAADQLVPLPEPARRGLINLADDVIATTNRLSPRLPKSTPATSRDQSGPMLRRAADTHSSPFRSSAQKIQRRKDHAGDAACHPPSRTRQPLLARTDCQRFAQLGTTLLRVRSRNGDLMRASGGIRSGRRRTRSWNRS